MERDDILTTLARIEQTILSQTEQMRKLADHVARQNGRLDKLEAWRIEEQAIRRERLRLEEQNAARLRWIIATVVTLAGALNAGVLAAINLLVR